MGSPPLQHAGLTKQAGGCHLRKLAAGKDPEMHRPQAALAGLQSQEAEEGPSCGGIPSPDEMGPSLGSQREIELPSRSKGAGQGPGFWI